MPANPAADDKAQFNVYLPRELIRRAKYASIDAGQSLSRLVEEALTAHLERLGTDSDGQDSAGQDREGQVRS
jgi:post-segregation antitoxin (ccd killing protein)